MKSVIHSITTVATVATTTLFGAIAVTSPTLAAEFGQQEVNQGSFIAIASPYRNGSAHQLLILEQVSDSRPCWSELGGQPTIIQPLLLDFDFTGICSRSTDSNGYSIRVNGEDFGLQYSLRIVRRDGDMWLVGAPRNRRDPEILIGHTNGTTSDFAKISLNPGWRFTKRTYDDRTLGHVYLTYEGDLAATLGEPGAGGSDPVVVDPGPEPIPALFGDTVNDIYLAEINQAVDIGFIAGFEDNTFRPLASLTREQLVSMVLEALSSLPGTNLTIPTQASGNPYSDVEATRWSAAKIQFARQNNIISGYEDGSFRPAQAVTRAELMAVLRRAAEYARTLQGQQPQLQGDRPATLFSDITGHWAGDLISQMSTFCSVASPLSERGDVFAPDTAAQRNYAAAATLRMLNCVNTSETAVQNSTVQNSTVQTSTEAIDQ